MGSDNKPDKQLPDSKRGDESQECFRSYKSRKPDNCSRNIASGVPNHELNEKITKLRADITKLLLIFLGMMLSILLTMTAIVIKLITG